MVSPGKCVGEGSHTKAQRKGGAWWISGMRPRPVPLEGGKGKDRGIEMESGWKREVSLYRPFGHFRVLILLRWDRKLMRTDLG